MITGKTSTYEVKFVDKFPRFSNSVERVMDEGLGELARDILVTARPRTPYSGTTSMRGKVGKVGRGTGGHLRADSYPEKVGNLNWQVVYNKEYADAQEKGYNSRGQTYRNYTTPGTGKGYLKNAGDKNRAKALMLLKKHGKRAKA